MTDDLLRFVVDSRGVAAPGEVLPSTEARAHLPRLIEGLIAHPEGEVEVGRQRRREVVMLAASRFDEMVERDRLLSDVAWRLFIEERLENPTSAPVGWDEAQRRRRSARG